MTIDGMPKSTYSKCLEKGYSNVFQAMLDYNNETLASYDGKAYFTTPVHFCCIANGKLLKWDHRTRSFVIACKHRLQNEIIETMKFNCIAESLR